MPKAQYQGGGSMKYILSVDEESGERKIEIAIVHASATPPEMDIGVKDIRVWHVEERGWSDIGYHFVIRRNGVVEIGRPLYLQGAHCRGYNRESVGICLVGGLDSNKNSINNFTREQELSLSSMIKFFSKDVVFGHNDFNKDKDCPCFNVEEWINSGTLSWDG